MRGGFAVPSRCWGAGAAPEPGVGLGEPPWLRAGCAGSSRGLAALSGRDQLD